MLKVSEVCFLGQVHLVTCVCNPVVVCLCSAVCVRLQPTLPLLSLPAVWGGWVGNDMQCNELVLKYKMYVRTLRVKLHGFGWEVCHATSL